MQHMDVNPLGLDGFEFAEFTSPDPDALARALRAAPGTPAPPLAGFGFEDRLPALLALYRRNLQA